MEIKYTIEILTKDIQDIEKLVGNLRNSKEATSIELDLALAKLRNVYEILTMIKADRFHEFIGESKDMETSASAQEPEVRQEPEPLVEKAAEPPVETETEQPPESASEVASTAATEKDSPPEPEPDVETEKKESTILAEKFTAESSINENLAGKMGNDTDAKLVGKPIDNISRNIGINDRFLIIRELFDGDSDQFTSLVNALDNAENYPAANGILKDQFAGTMDHEGVQILTGLLKRRFIR